MKAVQKIRLFLSSPGDVERERELVHKVVATINRTVGNNLDVVIEVVDWKTHIVPDMGRPQEVINEQVGDYDIFVGILWKRFGTPTGKAESGTEEEFNIAYDKWNKQKENIKKKWFNITSNKWKKLKNPHILFYFSQAAYAPQNSSDLGQWMKVMSFKEKFQQKGLPCDYQNPEEFSDLLHEHLVKLLQIWFKPVKTGQQPIIDFTAYLKSLSQETMHIDIRGLVTGKGKLHQFPIDELYIPLRTRYGIRDDREMVKERFDNDALLQEALKEQRLFIKGDPGSGKTTFMKLIAYTLCQGRLGETTKSMLTFSEPLPLPLLIRVGALSRYISQCTDRPNFSCPSEKDSPKWLLYYLESLGEEFKWKLSKEAFDKELEEGRCMILLDGLDEAPSREVRVHVSRLAANLVKAYPKCQVVVTSRPAALTDGDAVPFDFETVEIAALDDRGIEDFLIRWCSILYEGAPDKSERYKNELREALTHGQIKVMARTPVMLTALAVVHWNENRLPEQRAELYESVLTWLFRSRAEKEGRKRKLLQKLALAMFMHSEGRQRQVGLRWAAESLQSEFKADGEHDALTQAENFLHSEMVDSGVIVERELRLEYWHLSFQEYLAAFEIGGMLDDRLIETLFHENRLYSSEWREVVLLLGGVLYKQGEDRINNLINRIIERGPKESNNTTLPELSKEVALLGGIVQDLSPYKFEPSNARYKEITHSVMGIFNKDVFRSIPVQVREEAADALGRVGDPRFDRDKDLWVLIPGGSFWMGAQKSDPKGRNYDKDADPEDLGFKEWPVHEVELSEYWIGKYPVTVCQYRRFIEAGGYEDEGYWEAGGFGKFKEPGKWEEQLEHPTRPVVYVSWYEAKAYVEWSGCRLPTEAQWERAARGPGEEYRKYPCGNKEPDKETMNFNESIGHPTPVGIFPESCSLEGVIDMAGNVWEWCEDWLGDYSIKREVNPTGPKTGSFRVVRGGSWIDVARLCRSAYRIRGAPDYRGDLVGFRVLLLRS